MSYIGNNTVNQNYVPAVDYFNGDGSTVAFTLSRPVASVAAVQAVISNVPQNPGSAFTVSGSTITFTSAPPSGTANIYVYYTSPNTQVVQPGQGTVSIASFTASGAPSSATYLRGDNTWSAISGFDSGTLMLFQQTAAPTGWTKQTTHNDKALRVVSGTASSGGTSAFTTVFTNQTPTINTSGLSAGATTLSTTQIPSHGHSYTAPGSAVYDPAGGGSAVPSAGYGATTGSTGGGGSHTHSVSGSATASAITLNVQYVDLIIASKN